LPSARGVSLSLPDGDWAGQETVSTRVSIPEICRGAQSWSSSSVYFQVLRWCACGCRQTQEAQPVFAFGRHYGVAQRLVPTRRARSGLHVPAASGKRQASLATRDAVHRKTGHKAHALSETPMERSARLLQAQNSYSSANTHAGHQCTPPMSWGERSQPSSINNQLTNASHGGFPRGTQGSLLYGAKKQCAATLNVRLQATAPQHTRPPGVAQSPGCHRSLDAASARIDWGSTAQHESGIPSPSHSKGSSHSAILQHRVGSKLTHQPVAQPSTADSDSETDIDIGGDPAPAVQQIVQAQRPLFTCLFRRPDAAPQTDDADSTGLLEDGNRCSGGANAGREQAHDHRKSVDAPAEDVSDITSEADGVALAAKLASQVAQLPARSLFFFVRELNQHLPEDVAFRLVSKR
jgi:hypothetical protein